MFWRKTRSPEEVLRRLREEVREIEKKLAREKEINYLCSRLSLRRLETEDFQREAAERACEPLELSLIFPQDGEQWTRNKLCRVTWVYTGLVGEHLRIDLLKRGYLFREIALRWPLGTLKFEWVVPNEVPPATDYQIRLIARETGVEATSDFFQIG